MDLMLKLVKEFYRPMDERIVKEGVEKLLGKKELSISPSTSDGLNTEMFKVTHAFKELVQYYTDVNSAHATSGVLVMEDINRWLDTRGINGKMMVTHIENARRKMATRPEEVLASDHGFSLEELEGIKRTSYTHWDIKVYERMLEWLEWQGNQGQLKYEAYDLRSLQSLMGGGNNNTRRNRQGDAGDGKVVVNAVTSGGSQRGAQGGNGGGNKGNGGGNNGSKGGGSSKGSSGGSKGGGGNAGNTNQPCSKCGMFHDLPKGVTSCNIYDAKKNEFNCKNFMALPGVTFINWKGETTVFNTMRDRLIRFALKKWGIEGEAKQKLLKSLEEYCKRQPLKDQDGQASEKMANMSISSGGSKPAFSVNMAGASGDDDQDSVNSMPSMKSNNSGGSLSDDDDN